MQFSFHTFLAYQRKRLKIGGYTSRGIIGVKPHEVCREILDKKDNEGTDKVGEFIIKLQKTLANH